MIRRTTTCLLASFALCATISAAERAHGGIDDRNSGLQITPEGLRTLISKDVGEERWAITRNDDGTVTGNVFFRDGRDPIFINCTQTGITAAEVMLACESADVCTLAPCLAEAWTFIGNVTMPLSFFLPPAPPLPTGPLGRRRFSINPASSPLRTLTNFGSDETQGFEGWIELEGTAVDPATGQARIDVVGASPLITLEGVTTAGPIVICIEPDQEQFPIIGAGGIDCDGGTGFGYTIAYDHNAGVVGTGGFTEQQCEAIPGVVEDGPHTNLCNSGPVVGTNPTDSGPGGMIIAVLPGVGNPPFLVDITTETELPCGDEGPPTFSGPLPLTTGTIINTLRDADNAPGGMLELETTGSPFSCASFAQENGPGALTLSSVTFDLAPASFPGLYVDVLTAFVFDD